MHKQGKKLMDLRSREIGHLSLQSQKEIDTSDTKLKKTIYKASGGTEIFLTIITPSDKAVIGYLRLRQINNSYRPELYNKHVMMIRELKVVGKEVAIGGRTEDALQHKGFGAELLNEAIKISKEDFDCNKVYVLSGVGVKEYYRIHHNFKDDGVYLFKNLT
jgi:elongator complex protein 3